MDALKWIHKEVKRIKKAHPRKSHKAAMIEAGMAYRTAKTHKKSVGLVMDKQTVIRTFPKGRVTRTAGVSTKSKSHTDKNRITANIQIGAYEKADVPRKIQNEVLHKSKALLQLDALKRIPLKGLSAAQKSDLKKAKKYYYKVIIAHTHNIAQLKKLL